MEFEAVIGMEVHVQLNCKSKVFCGCSTDFHAPPNANVCPVCLGMPGAMPVLNREMVSKSVAVGLALGCKISRWSKMDRKNYFYPDQSKNYQISQYDLPVNYDGHLDITVDGVEQRIGITRAHMEEDTARNTHTLGGGQSGVDFNRCGVPLLEIVTEPDIRSADEAHAYLTELKQILQYLEVSDCSMEEGKLRAEANISVRPVGTEPFGTKTEVKNVASFSGTYKAIEFEIARQIQVINDGGTIVQETRGWDDDRGVTFSQRAKESAHDYRYFPEPDLVPIVVDNVWEGAIRDEQPELPTPRRKRMEKSYGLSPYDAGVLTQTRAMADYFETTADLVPDSKKAANWIMGDLQALITQDEGEIGAIKTSPEQLAAMINLIEDGTISGKIGKEVLTDMFATGQDPKAIVEAKGLVQISDTGALEQSIAEILAAHPAQVEEFRAGKEKVIGFLVGQVMKATQGKANPKMVNEILRKQLSN
jgi:aspartyl-tRNA(Asn)/glutamyl-tRNA(Gln) amidotransferase subunit B